MKKKKSLYIFVAILLAGSIFFSYKAWAQSQDSSQGLEVSPASQEINVDPNTTATVKASIRNTSRETIPIKVRIEDFTASGDEGQVALIDADKYSIQKWTKITPDTFSLRAGETQEVTATISIPKGAAGGRYGSFVFSVSPEHATPNAASVSQEIGSLFLMKISGPVNEQLVLTSIKAPSFSESGPIPLSMAFKNIGNVHVKTVGVINISNMFNQKTADIRVKPTNVFPGAERLIPATLDKHFLIGKYTATAIMYFGSKNEILSVTTSFWVIPIKIIAGILVVLTILFLMRKRFAKAAKVLFGK